MFHPEWLSGRNIPDYHPNSEEMIEWIREQKRRCLYGLDLGAGYKISGFQYFFLNFVHIDRIDQNKNPVWGYPDYNEKDHELFDLLTLAKSLKKGILLLTARGYGKTFVVLAIIAYYYTFFPASTNIISSSIAKYADDDFIRIKAILSKIPWFFYHNTDVANNEHRIISGTKVLDAYGQTRVVGYQSVIQKIVFDDNAGKARGTRPMTHLYEEIGDWSGAAKLIQCYNKSAEAYRRGSEFMCLPMLVGTGGSMKSGATIDAKEMFYNPEPFNLLAIDNSAGKKTCIFIPAYEKFGGFYGEDGINNIEGAKEHLLQEREVKKMNLENYFQHIQEMPFTEQEMFMTSDYSPFSILKQRLYELNIGQDVIPYETGYLKRTKDGVDFFPHPEGPVKILKGERPRVDHMGKPYDGLYLGGCDSYDQAIAFNSDSEGSIFIYKRFLNAHDTSRLFVAQYTARPNDLYEFYETCLMLAEYYNAQILIEFTAKAIFQYFELKGKDNYLADRPKSVYAGLKNAKPSNKKGLAMPKEIKIALISLYRNYCLNNLSSFHFSDQIQDHLEFNMEDNKFDRTMASMLCICQEREMVDQEVKVFQEVYAELPRWKVINGKRVFE